VFQEVIIEVNLASEPDAQLREKMLAIPTSLELPREDVKLLREHASRALKKSPEFQALLAAIQTKNQTPRP
jgi:hypothetical protein